MLALLNLKHFPLVRESDSSGVSNSSNSSIHQEKSFDAQDEGMAKILEELHSSNRETSVMVYLFRYG